MKDCIITFRSVTLAQRGEGVMKRAGIHCSLQRTPRHMEEQGCGYCLKLPLGRVREAATLLQEHHIAYRKLYLFRTGGAAEEIFL